MADLRRAGGGIVDVIIDAGDGDGLCGVPVGRGEDQYATDGRCRAGGAGGRDGDVAARLGVEDDSVLGCTAVFSGIAAGGRQGDAGDVVVVRGEGVGINSDAAVAGGGVADLRRAVAGIDDDVIDTGDGDGLWGVPVGCGEGQYATDGRCRAVVAGGRDGDVAAGFGVENDGVAFGAAVFTGIAACGGQGDAGGVIVGGGDCHAAGDAAVAAAAGGMGDVEGLCGTVGIVNAGDGDGLCRVPVGHGEGQCATDGGRIGVFAGRGDGDVAARLGVEDDAVVHGAGLTDVDAAGGEAQAVGIVVGGGHAHVAGDSAVAAAAGGMGDVEGLCGTVGIVNAGDGDGLCRVPVGHGEGQCATDGGRIGVFAGGGDGDVAARLGVEDDAVVHGAGLTDVDAAGGEAQAVGIVVGGGHAHVAGDSAVAAAAGGMGDVEGLCGTVGIVNAGDGDGLCRVPVGHGEGQCATDGGRIGVAAGGGDDDVAARLGVEDDAVVHGAGLTDVDAAGGEAQAVGIVVGGGHAHVAGDSAVAAAAGGMGDVEGLCGTVGIVNAGDGDGLCRVPVGHGEGQCATDGGRIGVFAGGGDGDVAARLGVEDDAVVHGAGLTDVDAAGGEAQAVGIVVGGGHAHVAGDSAVAAAAGGMGDVEGLCGTVGIVNAGDGDGLCRVPVGHGEGQCATDGGRIGVAAGGGDDDVAARLGVEDDAVVHGAGLTDVDAAGGEAQAVGIVVGGGHAHVAGDSVVAAAAGGMGDVEGLCGTVGIVNAGDGDGLCRVPVGHGEGQCATDGGRIGVFAGRGDGDVGGWGDSVGLVADLSHGERGGRKAQARDVVVVGGEDKVVHSDAAVAAGGVADGRGAVGAVFDSIVNAGDGDGLCRVPVGRGEGQCSTDGGCRVVVAGGVMVTSPLGSVSRTTV